MATVARISRWLLVLVISTYNSHADEFMYVWCYPFSVRDSVGDDALRRFDVALYNPTDSSIAYRILNSGKDIVLESGFLVPGQGIAYDLAGKVASVPRSTGVSNATVVATASGPLVINAGIVQPVSSDVSNILSTRFADTSFVVLNGESVFPTLVIGSTYNRFSTSTFIALEDSTRVEILSPVPLDNGYQRVDTIVQAFEAVTIRTAEHRLYDLSGTTVRTSRPGMLYLSHERYGWGGRGQTMNFLFEQSTGLRFSDTRFLVPDVTDPLGADSVRIKLAPILGPTNVQIEGKTVSLVPGSVLDVVVRAETVIDCDNLCVAIGLLPRTAGPGWDSVRAGDPSLFMVAGISQSDTVAVVYSPPSSDFPRSYITLTFEREPARISGTENMTKIREQLTPSIYSVTFRTGEGWHRVSSDKPFNAYGHGSSYADAYAYLAKYSGYPSYAAMFDTTKPEINVQEDCTALRVAVNDPGTIRSGLETILVQAFADSLITLSESYRGNGRDSMDISMHLMDSVTVLVRDIAGNTLVTNYRRKSYPLLCSTPRIFISGEGLNVSDTLAFLVNKGMIARKLESITALQNVAISVPPSASLPTVVQPNETLQVPIYASGTLPARDTIRALDECGDTIDVIVDFEPHPALFTGNSRCGVQVQTKVYSLLSVNDGRLVLEKPGRWSIYNLLGELLATEKVVVPGEIQVKNLPPLVLVITE